MTACLYTLAMAVNIGAFGFTFPASLAGLLWRELLKQKGVIVREREFLRRLVVHLFPSAFRMRDDPVDHHFSFGPSQELASPHRVRRRQQRGHPGRGGRHAPGVRRIGCG